METKENLINLFSFLSKEQELNVTYISIYSMIINNGRYAIYLNRAQHYREFSNDVGKIIFNYNFLKYNKLNEFLESKDLETRNLGLSLLIKEEIKDENDS